MEKVRESVFEPFQVRQNGLEGKFIICCGQFRASKHEFKTKEDAQAYIDSKPWELIHVLMVLNIKIEKNESFVNETSAGATNEERPQNSTENTTMDK